MFFFSNNRSQWWLEIVLVIKAISKERKRDTTFSPVASTTRSCRILFTTVDSEWGWAIALLLLVSMSRSTSTAISNVEAKVFRCEVIDWFVVLRFSFSFPMVFLFPGFLECFLWNRFGVLWVKLLQSAVSVRTSSTYCICLENYFRESRWCILQDLFFCGWWALYYIVNDTYDTKFGTVLYNTVCSSIPFRGREEGNLLQHQQNSRNNNNKRQHRYSISHLLLGYKKALAIVSEFLPLSVWGLQQWTNRYIYTDRRREIGRNLKQQQHLIPNLFSVPFRIIFYFHSRNKSSSSIQWSLVHFRTPHSDNAIKPTKTQLFYRGFHNPVCEETNHISFDNLQTRNGKRWFQTSCSIRFGCCFLDISTTTRLLRSSPGHLLWAWFGYRKSCKNAYRKSLPESGHFPWVSTWTRTTRTNSALPTPGTPRWLMYLPSSDEW